MDKNIEKKNSFIKEIIPSLILVFVTCFMLLICEPTIMYAANMSDFWFDYHMLIKTMMIYFLIAFILLSLLFILVYFINKKLFKDKKIYEVFHVIALIVFIATYIQGNYLVGDLPVLSGDEIDWNSFLVNDIITLIVWITLIVISVILCKKYGIKEIVKKSIYLPLAIFVMLFTSMIPSLFTENLFMSKDLIDITTENLNVASTDKNYYILLLDAVDSRTFNEIMESTEYKGMLNDFTYYPDTISGYPLTRDSIPLILSGNLNRNEKDFQDFFRESLNNSKLIKELKKQNYSINIYENENMGLTNIIDDIANIKKNNDFTRTKYIAKQETKYILFRYLPYFAKKYINVNNLSYDSYYSYQNPYIFNWYDRFYYFFIKERGFTTTDEKIFQFVHMQGAHPPFHFDENLDWIDSKDGNYEMEVTASIKAVSVFIEELKKSNQYDNSIIVIMGDHGFANHDNPNELARMNPALYIKTIDEHHDSQNISNKQISYNYICDSLIDLLNGDEVFKDITEHETRSFIWYTFTHEDQMTEYETKGKAWETNKMYKTGKEFNR